jgi:hypothetical protein
LVAESECLFIIKSELELVLVESESELYNRGNHTSHIYFGVRLTREREYLLITCIPLLFLEKACGDLLTYIPLFIESVFEVLLKKEKKKKKRDSVKKIKKKRKKARANSLRLFFPSVRGGAL